MRVLFRTDSSFLNGTGHVIRCLTLAHALKKAGDHVDFYSLPLPGNISNQILEQGFTVFEAPESIQRSSYDLCIVDQYTLQASDEDQLRVFASKIVVIDDWGSRTHHADYIIDPSVSAFTEDRKRSNPNTPFFSGKDWVILRPEFTEHHSRSRPRTTLNEVLVFFGGTDPQLQTARYWEAIEKLRLNQKLNFHFLISKNHPEAANICARPIPENFKLYVSPPSVAQIMNQMDFYVGSGGTITWERMSLGLTGSVISVVDNQRPDSQILAEQGFQIYLGDYHQVTPEQAIDSIMQIQNNLSLLHKMSKRCLDLIDARGVERIVSLLKG